MNRHVTKVTLAVAGIYIAAAANALAQADFRGGPPPADARPTQGTIVGRPGGAEVPSAYQVRSNPRGLLQRPEIQAEIGLDLKQRNELAAIQEEGVNGVRERVRQALQGQNAPFRNMTPQQRQQWLQQQQALIEQMEASSRQNQGELDEKVRKILKPEQLERLHELDLQKRGPLALGDPRVAQELNLSQQTRAAESRILSEYQSELGRIANEAMQEALKNADPRRGAAPDFTSRLSPARKKLDANKEQAEKKALEALTEEEAEAWKNAQGKPFHFRPDPVTPQRPQQQRRGSLLP